MPGYVKGTDVPRELARIRELVALVGADMQSDPEPSRAFATATALERLGAEVSNGASAFRAWFAAELADERHMTQARIAEVLGISPGRVGQLVRAGRERKGNPIVDPGTQPLALPVALAIVTGPRGVLVVHRRDKRPPWSFPGGEFSHYFEPPADAARRRVPAETGYDVEVMAVLGDRVHPRTGHRMVYLSCRVVPDAEDREPVLGAEDPDLDAVEWIGLDAVRERMPDMYPPAQAHLEAVLSAIDRF